MVGDQQPGAENNCQYRRWRHDVPEQLPFHDLEAILTDLVLAHGVIDEQARQIENPAKPANYPDDMKGFNPKHVALLHSWGRSYHSLRVYVLMIARIVAKPLILRNEMLPDIAI